MEYIALNGYLSTCLLILSVDINKLMQSSVYKGVVKFGLVSFDSKLSPMSHSSQVPLL